MSDDSDDSDLDVKEDDGPMVEEHNPTGYQNKGLMNYRKVRADWTAGGTSLFFFSTSQHLFP